MNLNINLFTFNSFICVRDFELKRFVVGFDACK
jgi:hypothetical protein